MKHHADSNQAILDHIRKQKEEASNKFESLISENHSKSGRLAALNQQQSDIQSKVQMYKDLTCKLDVEIEEREVQYGLLKK